MLVPIETSTAILRLALALLLGAIIGIEREWRHKKAGVKTNMLVAIGAAAFAMLSNTFGPGNHNPAQLAAAVVSGIGFIGAGVIIHRGGSVQGVTTAATLWANASMGVAVGTGHRLVGVAIFGAVVIVQVAMRPAVQVIAVLREQSLPQQIDVRIECTPEALEQVRAAWTELAEAKHIAATRRGLQRHDALMIWRVSFTIRPPVTIDFAAFEERIAKLEGIESIDVRQLPGDDPDN
jgi:uncharacterized membrane protein YhiD involved in acid resistance